MAFNPLANFQKYKKIWMASTILLCMVTFVLCSGFGGSGDQANENLTLRRRQPACEPDHAINRATTEPCKVMGLPVVSGAGSQ